MGILLTIESDKGHFSYVTMSEWISLTSNHLKYLHIESTSKIKFIRPIATDSILGGYNLTLYKVSSHKNDLNFRYLISYSDFNNKNVWLRAKGYVVNDMNLLFNHFKEHKKLNNTILKQMIKEWESSNELFKELELQCLLKGYIKNKTNSECFISISYSTTVCNYTIGPSLTEDELFSIFSVSPVFNCFEPVY
jgi:hypothetical protein